VSMSIDHGVSELSASRPRLRRDVRTHFQEYRGRPSYIVEDTSKGRFFHIGFPEHQFLQSLDGRTTFAQALARNAATQGDEALTEQQGDQLLRWLVDNDLLESDTSGQGERRREHWVRQKEKRETNPVAKIFFFKIPFGCPDRLIARATRYFGWIFGAAGLLLWAGLLLFAAVSFAPHWDRFLSGAGAVVAPSGWLWMAGTYAILKVLHEFGHGIAAKRYGGSVPEWGVQLLAFVTPLAFVDASSSSKFPSKWHRILVAAAGMYVEAGVAALCVLAWIHTDPGILNTALHSAVVAATLVTLLFNANPLMRFDGYYILCDFLGIPNLGTKGQQFLKWVGKRWILGVSDLPMPSAARLHPVAVPLYGVLAAIWKLIIWIGITILVSVLFKGAGLALALGATAFTLGLMTVRFVRKLAKRDAGVRPSTALVRIAALVLGLLAFFFLVRIDPTARAPVVVEFAEQERLRAGLRGFVEAVHVREGDHVEAGTLLVEISNLDEEIARDQLRLELGNARLRARQYYQQEDLSAYQAELEVVGGLESTLEESERYLAAARVEAPVAGRVVARQLASLPGRWVEVGEELLSLSASEAKEILVSFRQDDIEAVLAADPPEIGVRLRGRRGTFRAGLERVESRATTAVPHPALAAPGGGPLPLRAESEPVSERERELSVRDTFARSELSHFAALGEAPTLQELVAPRFAARAALLEPAEGNDWSSGEWGWARLSNTKKESLGTWIFRGLGSYVREKIDQAKAAAG